VVLVSFVSANVVNPYDSSSILLHRLHQMEEGNVVSNSSNGGIIENFLFGFGNWDGIYFNEIAYNGYTYEQFHAFFPLYPLLMRIIFNLVLFIFPFVTLLVSETMMLLVIGVIISNVSFVMAAVYLYLLTKNVYRSDEVSYYAAVFFCFNPAGIFMSSLYTESIFSMFVFGGIYYYSGEKILQSAIFFMLACSTRSNGTLLAGYIAYYYLMKLISIIMFEKDHFCNKFLISTTLIFKSIIYFLILLSPLILFQYYGYMLFCTELNLAFPRPWCEDFIPLLYQFVQVYYWNNGFLTYWQFKQIPNFLLASPFLTLSFWAIWNYFSLTRKKMINLKDKSFIKTFQFIKDSHLEYYIYWLFICLFALFSMNIQVITRFGCSQCPPFYWVLSIEFIKNIKAKSTKAIFLYLFTYNIIGPLLFINFYPWT